MSGSILPTPIRRTRPRVEGEQSLTSSYTALSQVVREAGLLRRRQGFYAMLGGVLVALLGGAVAGFVLLGDSWFQLLIAAALGVIFTQVAFFAHEASHRQVFETGPANDRLGRWMATAVVGMSYQWWMSKHTRHHANPNKVGKDPDIENDTVSFHEEAAAQRTGLGALITRHQGKLFFPLMMLEGVNLHAKSIGSLLGKGRVEGRAFELTLLALRLGLYVGVVFWVLPLGMAFAFLGVQLAVFGVYMGASFAPNHLALPVVPRDAKLDFLRKQVLTSRNISGGWRASAFMGGLNYQIEHHLFPNMPRPHLSRAREIVREYCATIDVPYHETTLMQAWITVQRYMTRVGSFATDTFACPLVGQFRRA